MDFTFFYTGFRFGFFIVFTALHIGLMAGLVLERLREKAALKRALPSFPGVSVIIPVHNESCRIAPLLRSLAAQDYPKAEIIFVDDRSADSTAAIIAAFIRDLLKDSPLSVKVIRLAENPGPNYKQYALARGIEAACGEFLLFTDADCEVPPQWIRCMVKRMCAAETGVVIGPVLKRSGGRGFFHLYQCYEHGVRYLYLAGAIGLGSAGGGFGNNLILRRKSLDAVGGYDNIPPSPTEDAALISRIRARSGYKARAAFGVDVHVITQTEACWKDFINQTLRWNNGGIFSPDTVTRLNYTFLMVMTSAGVLAVPLLPFIPSLWPLPIATITVMIFNTIANLVFFALSLPKRRGAFVLALLFTPAYFTLMTLLGFLGIKPTWKGKTV